MISFKKFSLKNVRRKALIVKETEIGYKICILVPAQAATIAPPIGSALGQFGINIMDFCKQFNEQTKDFDLNSLLLVKLYIFKNKTFHFDIMLPSCSFLLNEENFYLDNDQIPKYLNLSALYNIFLLKQRTKFLITNSLLKMLLGSYKGMKIKLCNDLFE